jgi:hypothetical protein
MSFLGLGLLDWTAIAAIGTLALAVAATATIVVTVRMARAEQERDDTKRAEDRQWDADRRKEDRDRDDQLRREDREASERRFRAEQRDREDYEARQVTVEFASAAPKMSSAGRDPNRAIAVSTPSTYPIKWVDAMIVFRSGGSLSLADPRWGWEPPVTENGQTLFRRWAEITNRMEDPAVIVRFADPHGNLYYAYGQQTWRFPQNTDWITAATEIDHWIRTGPKPDEPS